VFTLPAPVAAIACQNKALLYAMLFEAASETLRTIAGDPRRLGAEIGATMVLHTWGQTLTHHPHVHCIVPGGGIAPDGQRWIACRPRFFLPVRVLSRLYRRLFLDKLAAVHRAGKMRFFGELMPLADRRKFDVMLAPLRRTEWVVFAKRPFAGPTQALAYLSRYTHRIAISNHRLVGMDGSTVSFTWKDYRHGAAPRCMTLAADEFMRRFLLHVLPHGFQRIRHYGFLANGHRKTKLALIRKWLAVPAPTLPADDAGTPAAPEARSASPCPCCGGTMVITSPGRTRARPRTEVRQLMTIRSRSSASCAATARQRYLLRCRQPCRDKKAVVATIMSAAVPNFRCGYASAIIPMHPSRPHRSTPEHQSP